MPNVWPYWVDQGTMGGTFATNATLWQGWVQTTGTVATTYPDQWYAWQTVTPQLTTTGASYTVWANWQGVSNISPAYPSREVSPEEKARQARNTLISRQRSRAAQLRRNIAGRKAEALLLAHLSETQREEWLADRAFHVETADGQRRYRIEYGLAGNVRLVKAEELPIGKRGVPIRVGARFCMHVYHPEGPVPHQDNVLAQKLLIEANERHFLDLANVS